MNAAKKLFNLMSEPARSMIEGATVSTYERTTPKVTWTVQKRSASVRLRGMFPKPYSPLATYGPTKWRFRFQDAAGISHPDPDNREYDSDYEATQAMRRFCITRGENPNVPWPYNHSISENISLVA